MKLTFTPASAIRILRDGITKGYWTLQDLDRAPPGTAMNLAEYRHHPMAANFKGEFPAYRNLLRECSDSEDIPEDDFIL